MTNKTKAFFNWPIVARTQIWIHTGSPEQGFRRCFADGVNQSLISSARRLANLERQSFSLRTFFYLGKVQIPNQESLLYFAMGVDRPLAKCRNGPISNHDL